MQKGFSLIELMITVAVIGILTLMGMPLYKDFLMRVRITQVVDSITILAHEAELSLATGDWDLAFDIKKASVDYGLPLTPMGCAGGYEYGKVGGASLNPALISKLEAAFGVDMTYLNGFIYHGFFRSTMCAGQAMHEKPAVEIAFSLNPDSFGIKAQGSKTGNYMILQVVEEVDFLDTKGNLVDKRRNGVFKSCGIYHAGGISKFDFPISAIPKQCRYFMMSTANPRKLMALD